MLTRAWPFSERDDARREIHRRTADEAADELASPAVVDDHRLGDLDDLALAHDRDAVAQAERLDLVVGDVDRRRLDVADQLLQLGPELQPQQRVEVGQRLVHQQHRRLHDDRPRHRHALALAAAESCAGVAPEVRLELQQAGRALDALR